MTSMTESLERAMRDRVRETAATMRRYAAEMENASVYPDATQIPALSVQVLVNLMMNMRLDLPATYLGEIVKMERAELEIAEQARGSYRPGEES
jgi:hypothetical protein